MILKDNYIKNKELLNSKKILKKEIIIDNNSDSDKEVIIKLEEYTKIIRLEYYSLKQINNYNYLKFGNNIINLEYYINPHHRFFNIASIGSKPTSGTIPLNLSKENFEDLYKDAMTIVLPEIGLKNINSKELNFKIKYKNIINIKIYADFKDIKNKKIIKIFK